MSQDSTPTGEPLTIDFTPRAIDGVEQVRAQRVLDASYPGHVLVVPDGSDAWLLREFIDRGLTEEEAFEHLDLHAAKPFELTIPKENQAPPWDEVVGRCAELAEAAAEGDDCTLGEDGDEAPAEDADIRCYRVRRGTVGDGAEPYSVPSYPIFIEYTDFENGQGVVIAIN